MPPNVFPLPPAPLTLRGLVDRMAREIIGQRRNEKVPSVLGYAEPDILHKYYSLHGSGTSKGTLSLSSEEFRAIVEILPSKDNVPEYEDAYALALSNRRFCLDGKSPEFHRMDLDKPPLKANWLHNVVALSEEYGIGFEPPRVSNIDRQIDLYVHGVRGVRGEIAAMDAAYSLLRVHDQHARGDKPVDETHCRLTILYHTIDLAAQIGACRHLGFLVGEIERSKAAAAAGSDVDGIIGRMRAYCDAQIKCVSPPRRLTTAYFKALRDDTDAAVGAWDPGKVSGEVALHLSSLVAGWTGAHFQRVASRIAANPTRGEFDGILGDHDDVAGILGARFPSRFSLPLFIDCIKREDYSNAYVAEILALRALMRVDDDEEAGRAATGLYPLNGRLVEAQAILDAGLKSTLFADRTHDAIKAEMMHWKLVLILSSFRKTRSQADRHAYAQAKREAREVMGRIGMLGRLEKLEAFQEINAGYKI